MSLNEDERVELLQAVFDHYGLKYPSKSGQSSILCPVHDDRRPSASVNTTSGLWTCYACGVSGDGFTIIEQREGVGFADANKIAKGILGRSDFGVRGGVSRLPSGAVHRKQGAGSSPGSAYVPPWSRL